MTNGAVSRFTRVIVGTFLASICLVSCASFPDATINYRLSQTEVRIKVVRTVMCNAADELIQAYATTPTATHRASEQECPDCRIPLSSLRGPLSDSDIKVELEEDGRLKSINATNTGQAEAALRAFVTFASSAKGMVASANQDAVRAACSEIRRMMGDKPLTLTYEGAVTIEVPPNTDTTSQPAAPANAPAISGATTAPEHSPQTIGPDATSALIAAKAPFTGIIGAVCARVVKTDKTATAPEFLPLTQAKNASVLLQVRQPGSARIQVTAGKDGQCQSGDLEIWEGIVPVAQLGKMYNLPLPRPAAFGKRSVAATFSGAGALTSLQYATTSGAAQSFNLLNATASELASSTAKEKADEAKAEADLIFQQQRLAQCVADPKNCK